MEPVSQPSWETLGLPTSVLSSINALGWKNPTPIQNETLPYSLNGRDVIGLAETGSGKTGAFAIPIIKALLETPQGLFALILAPTRELAFQISDTFEALGASLLLTVAVLVGGIDLTGQALILAKRPHVIIGTPGRVVYHLQNTRGFSLRNIKYFVLDEADRLLNLDFEQEINTILSVLPKERRSFLFSATMTSKVSKLQRASLDNPVKCEVNTKHSTVSTLQQNYLFVPEKYKDCYLAYLMNEYAGNSIIVFVLQCVTCQRIALTLRNLGFSAIPLNGKMTQEKRLGALNKFKAGKTKILVATDVASRGLDIPEVDLIINFDIPLSPKDYVHRVGRTARAGKSGRALSLVTQYDVESFIKCEEFIKQKLEIFPTEEDSVLVFMERVSEASRIAAMELRETGFGQKKRKLTSEDLREDESLETSHKKQKQDGSNNNKHSNSSHKGQRGGHGGGRGKRGKK